MEKSSVEYLLEKTGDFGKFQIFALLSIISPELPSGIIGMLPVFVGGIPAQWDCHLGDGVTTQIPSIEICKCNGTLRGPRTSIVSEWNLVCDYAWVSDLITSIQMAGMLTGGLVGSQVADWVGRKRTMYVSCLLMFIMAAASSVAPTPFVYAGTRFVIGFSMATYLVVGAIYPMEFFTPKWRSLSGTLGPWGEGVMLLPLFAYYFPDWRTLSWVTALPMAITLVTFPFLPESPRWLLDKGKLDEAKGVFAQIGRWNGSVGVEEQDIEKVAACMRLGKGENDSSSQAGYTQLLCNGNYRTKILPFMGMWFSYSLIYYGISFNTKNLSGNIYLNMVYMGIIDSVGFPLTVPVITWLGRRKATIAYAVVTTIPITAVVLMELNLLIRHSTVVLVVLSLVCKFCVAGGWSGIKCFTGESFPTTIRSSALGICTVTAALGGVVAPLIVFLGTLNQSLPYFVFGGLAVTNACLTLFLEETKGKPIQEGRD